jgi:predicted outer membrane repeat protein
MTLRTALPLGLLALLGCSPSADDSVLTDVPADRVEVRDGDAVAPPDGGPDDVVPDLPAEDAVVAEDAVDGAVDETPPPPDVAVDDAGDPDGLWMCPPPGGLDCVTPGTGDGVTCFDGVSCFMDEVQAAVRGVIADHPDWFRRDDELSCEVVVVDGLVYRQAVVDALNARGDLCAIPDPNAGDEVAIKYNNTYAENFDILASNGCARYGGAIYTSTCYTAWF